MGQTAGLEHDVLAQGWSAPPRAERSPGEAFDNNKLASRVGEVSFLVERIAAKRRFGAVSRFMRLTHEVEHDKQCVNPAA